MAKNKVQLPASFKALGAEIRLRKRRLLIASEGPQKTGKNHWAFTAPDPIIVIDIDKGCEGMIEKFWDGTADGVTRPKAIGVIPIKFSPIGTHDVWQKDWLNLKKVYEDAVKNPDARTIIVDKAGDMYNLLRLAKFGKLTQVPPMKYHEVNNMFNALIRQAYDAEKNLILIHGVTKNFVDGKKKDGNGQPIKEWDGTYVREGYKNTGYLIQVNIEHMFDPSRDPIDEGQFGIRIQDCRQNMMLSGEELWGEQATFKGLAELIWPDSEGEWD